MSSPIKAFQNLQPRTRAIVGVSLLAWGVAGLYISDAAEKKLGFEAGPEDRERLERAMPRITVVDREEGRGRSEGR